MRSSLTLNGLYQYDDTIFNGFLLAEDTLGISLENTVNAILQVCDGLEVLYPNPRQLAFQIDVWTSANEDNWKRILDALQAEYSPIENFDRREEWEDSSERKDNTTTMHTGNTTGRGRSIVNDDGSTTHEERGYNSYQMQETDSDTFTDVKESFTDDNTSVNSTTSNTGTVGNTGKHSGRLHGNIGVTTNQQMVEAELQLRTRNAFDYIVAEEFKQRFCLLVY